MNKIPEKLKKQILADPEYRRCCLLGYHQCGGRITFEHALTFKGRQLQERFAIIPLCARGHGVDQWQDAGTLEKERNIWVALNRATDEELWSISSAVNYHDLRKRLNYKYGPYIPPTMYPTNVIHF